MELAKWYHPAASRVKREKRKKRQRVGHPPFYSGGSEVDVGVSAQPPALVAAATGQEEVAVPLAIGGGALALHGAATQTVASAQMAKSALGPKPGESGGPGSGKPISPKTKAAALEENKAANGGQAKCVFCGEPVGEGTGNKINYDHAQARSKKGTPRLNNVNVTCEYCNKSKGTGEAPKNPKGGLPRHLQSFGSGGLVFQNGKFQFLAPQQQQP